MAKGPTINVMLRSPQADFLDRVAERSDVSASRVFGSLLERHIASDPQPSRRTPRKARKHFSIQPHHLEALDRLAAKLGLSKADVARRLIDDARTADPLMSL